MCICVCLVHGTVHVCRHVIRVYPYNIRRATLLDGMNAEFRIEKVFIQIVSTAFRCLRVRI